jgi:flagellar biosynthesis/type III secretory pathway M-ring protein FliF/YscJ
MSVEPSVTPSVTSSPRPAVASASDTSGPGFFWPIVVGSVVLLLIAAFLIVFLARRKRSQQAEGATEATTS